MATQEIRSGTNYIHIFSAWRLRVHAIHQLKPNILSPFVKQTRTELKPLNLALKKEMSIHIKLSTTLRAYLPSYNPQDGLNLPFDPSQYPHPQALAQKLGLPISEIKFIMINGRYQLMNTLIKDGDRIAFFPAVGGG